ncbi:hypothetical protein, partial [Klebsiella pneumoniae]|uniref:hypothetical protein n=1 Tax=Klebsiella pneumoniae TaxID=573 RepID=UPI001F156081
MPDLKSQDLVTHSFHHLKEKAFILPPAAQKEISRQKNVLPRNKFINIGILRRQRPSRPEINMIDKL